MDETDNGVQALVNQRVAITLGQAIIDGIIANARAEAAEAQNARLGESLQKLGGEVAELTATLETLKALKEGEDPHDEDVSSRMA